MRLGTEITLSETLLPKDYRRGFTSIIKKAIQTDNELLYESYYGDEARTDKPFTFSVYFPDLRGAENGKLHVGEKANLNFSTNDPALITHLYNGLRKTDEHEWSGISLKPGNTRLFPFRKIKSDKIVLKTASPFLVKSKDDNSWYLSSEDDGFDESFRHSINGIVNTFLGVSEPDFEYTIRKHKKMVLWHYGQWMTGNKAVIEMNARTEILNLLYNVGIGVRRSQGFGMVELVNS